MEQLKKKKIINILYILTTIVSRFTLAHWRSASQFSEAIKQLKFKQVTYLSSTSI
jgi:hypothetical protein